MWAGTYTHLERRDRGPGQSCGSKASSAAPGDLGASSLMCVVDSMGLSSAWDLLHPQMQPLRKRRDRFWSIEFISRGGG